MIRKISKKITSIFMALAILVSYVFPITTVFAASTVTVNVTATGIVAHIKITTAADPNNPGEISKECLTTDTDPEMQACPMSFEGDALKYYIHIEPDFITGGRISTISIDGDNKTVNSPTGTNTYMVSAKSSYNIVVTGVAEEHYNIMWANDGAKVTGTDFDDPEVLLKNGFAKVIKVYNNETDMNDISNEIEHIEDGCVDPEGKGYVNLSEGNVVIFEFTPKYGYQLTSVSANGTKLEAQDTMNQYKYIMPATNIHFQATFTKTNDVVKSTTNKVTSGTVKIGTNEINAGSTVLSVKDAVLTDTQKLTFENKAGDYTVSNVFDIKLDQVFYKGSTNDNDVWSKPLGYSEDLQTPATITLKLDESVDGNKVILIHEKENGEYETIDTNYNSKTHTISFSTSSFSNYALASKTIENPQTGDNVIVYMVLSLMSILLGTKLIKKLN